MAVEEVRAPGAVALLFPGQGAQRPGMGQPWIETESWALVAALAELTGRDIAGLLLHADAATLRRTDNAQLATFALEMVVLAELAAAGLPVDGVAGCAGHSLGEYSALVAAGVLGLADAARVVSVRAEAMVAAARQRPGTMAVVVNADHADSVGLVTRVREAGAEVWVAGINAPQQITVAGTESGLAALDAGVREIGGKLIDLRVGGAFHTPFMSPAVPAVAAALAAVAVMPGRTALVTNADGLVKKGPADWAELACRQLVEPVQWHRTMQSLTGDLGARILVEVGPGKALCGLARLHDRALVALTVNCPADIPAAARAAEAARESPGR
ncbi:ACP S-malonyltransferase [Nocardia sp. N2S4-5]|uniref:ACP S-malonyltransferase n=1 Tax=Nocardia sp. N2S4-5 TaxID=3351565 RepID=UPI0037CF24E8